jgi:hypothetical protein
MAQPLHSIADAEDRHLEIEQAAVCLGRAFVENRMRPAGKNYAFGVLRFYFSERRVGRKDFAVNAKLTDAAGDQLGKLTPKVEN